MGRSIQTWKQGLLWGSILALVGVQGLPVLAQTAPIGSTPDPNQDIDNVFNNRDSSAGSLYSIINRLQLLNGRSPADFAAEQDENFNSAVSDFRKKQQQQLQAPVTPPTVSPVKPTPIP